MVKVKICGITNFDDALLACELGADALGFVFHKPSPRYIEPQRASAIMRHLPPFVVKVGVVVNMPIYQLKSLCQQLPLDLMQLHGDESPEYCQQVTPCLKAFRMKDDFELAELGKYQTAGYVLDTFVDGSTYGGTGVAFDWRIAKSAKRFGKIILAGGLHTGNVAPALRMVQPYAVDVSSGVEARPGKKDPAKLKSFFEEIQKYNEQSLL